MTAETGSLVPARLRGLRAYRGRRFDATETRLGAIRARPAGVEERIEAIETRPGGWRSVLAAATGSIVADMRDHETRIAALEGTPA